VQNSACKAEELLVWAVNMVKSNMLHADLHAPL
jgi:hypothetical protein